MEETTFTPDAGSSVSADSASSIDTGASTDANAAWASVFAKAGESAQTTQTTEDVAAGPEPEADPVAEDPSEIADGSEGQAPADDELDPNDFEPDSTRDGARGKQFFFRESKAKSLMAAKDAMNRITDAVPNATPESIRAYYDQAVTFDQMIADFDSGDPERVSTFTNYWLSNEAPQHARDTFAAQVMERLPQSAPQVFQQFQRNAEQSLIQGLYQQALQRNDEELLKVAQHLDYHKRGAFRERADFQKRDPMIEERQRLDQDRQRFENEQRQVAQRDLQARTQNIDQQVKANRNSEIEAALKSVETQYKDKPQWKHMLRDLTEKVEESITANPAWQRQFALARERAIKDPSGKAAEDLSQMIRNFVQPIVGRNRVSIINAATGTVLSASAEAHTKARQQAAKREPASTGTPVQRGVLDARMQEAVKKGDADAAWSIVGERSKLSAARR